MNATAILIGISLTGYALVSRADCVSETCNSERLRVGEQHQRCSVIDLPTDKAECYRLYYAPAREAFQACVRSCNLNGHNKTMEKKVQNKNPRPIADGMGQSVNQNNTKSGPSNVAATTQTGKPSVDAALKSAQDSMRAEKAKSNSD